MTGDERSDEREQGVETGGEIDVHVGEDVGLRRRPDGGQGPAAALLVEVDHPDVGEPGGQPGRDLEGRIRAAVVGDRDPGGEGERRGEVVVEAFDAPGQGACLVVDGHGDVEDGRRAAACEPGRIRRLVDEPTGVGAEVAAGTHHVLAVRS